MEEQVQLKTVSHRAFPVLAYLGLSMMRADTSSFPPVLMYGDGVRGWKAVMQSLFGKFMQEMTFQEFRKWKKEKAHWQYVVYWVTDFTNRDLERYIREHDPSLLQSLWWRRLRARLWFADPDAVPSKDMAKWFTVCHIPTTPPVVNRIVTQDEAKSYLTYLAVNAYLDGCHLGLFQTR